MLLILQMLGRYTVWGFSAQINRVMVNCWPGSGATHLLTTIARCLLGALGISLMAWGIGMPIVALFGAEAQGQITQVRRQLGDRGEAIPNRYAYVISYEFRLPDGTLAVGVTHRTGDYFSPRWLTKGKVVQVRYLPGLPRISEVDWQWGAAVECLIVAAVGWLLVYLPWIKKIPTKPKISKR